MNLNGEFLATLAPAVVLLLGLFISVVLDQYLRSDARKNMVAIIILCSCLMAQNILENWLAEGEPLPAWRTFTAMLGYCVRPMILVLFLCIVKPDKKHWISWALVGVNALIYLTAPFSGIAFKITEDNHYVGGPLSNTCLVVSVILLFALLFQTFESFKGGKKRDMLIPVFVVVMIVLSVAMDHYFWYPNQPLAFLTIAVVISCVFFYVWLQLQFVREHERDLMAQNRIKIMVSQIQPHFLYNTIATFKTLCRKDPDKAADVAEKFGQYLQQNLDSLETEGLIPAEKELEHTRLYADIEMSRFENVRVEYDAQDLDFSIPPLTIQPMVENAIRHGVRIREKGIVRVSTRRTEKGHEIRIWDNGMGFDVATLKQDKGSGVGIQNVRERIEKLCGGTMTIQSDVGKGTTVFMRIPQGWVKQ